MIERRLGVAAAVVDGVLVEGDVAIADGQVTEVGLTPGGQGTAVPGFVDLQVNGYGGIDLLDDADDDAWRAAGAALLRAGVTAYQPTLITAPRGPVLDALGRAGRVARDPGAGARILGVHLEGPFLSPLRLGTHPIEHRLDPDLDLLREQLAAGPVSMVTIAPELPGAGEVIDELVARQVTVSVGHSAATAEVAARAFARGARSATHVFNAMTGISARNPGVAAAALADRSAVLMCIVDGVHLADETVDVVASCALERLALTSDAIAAAGMGDGTYALGTVEVTVRDGRATRADGTLAGGIGSLVGAVRRLVAHGVSLAAAVAAASSIPAALVRCPEAGALRPGARADVVVLDEELEVSRVLLAGAMVEEAGR